MILHKFINLSQNVAIVMILRQKLRIIDKNRTFAIIKSPQLLLSLQSYNKTKILKVTFLSKRACRKNESTIHSTQKTKEEILQCLRQSKEIWILCQNPGLVDFLNLCV